MDVKTEVMLVKLRNLLEQAYLTSSDLAVDLIHDEGHVTLTKIEAEAVCSYMTQAEARCVTEQYQTALVTATKKLQLATR
jgi:hypothetical protein